MSIGVVACIAALLFLRTHLGYFRSPVYLGGLIVIEIVLASLWHFEVAFFPLLIFSFLWAGMDLPWTGVPLTARWFVLSVAAVVGFVMWMRERRHSYTAFHLVALFCVTAALVSAIVSADPRTALLKVGSLLLLFVYGATGARLAILGREVRFVQGLLLGCEIAVYVSAVAYLGAGAQIFGNPNSLGAVMGVAATPFLLWGVLIADTRQQRYRRAVALALAGLLLYTSLSRASILAAVVSGLTLCIALRRQRLLIQGMFLVVLLLAVSAVWDPPHFDNFVNTFTSDVIYKGKKEGGVLGSRKTPWEETVAVVKEHPWFGSGFGTSNMGQWAQRRTLTMDPSEGGLYTKEGTNREHGNSYLALTEYLGLLGILPFAVLLFLLVRMIWQVCLWMRSTSNAGHCAIPLAMMLLSGLVHAVFEDWLVAVGYYLCVFFWCGAFWLRDLVPAIPLSVTAVPATHQRTAKSYSGTLLAGR
jgi:O-antigen ligase